MPPSIPQNDRVVTECSKAGQLSCRVLVLESANDFITRERRDGELPLFLEIGGRVLKHLAVLLLPTPVTRYPQSELP